MIRPWRKTRSRAVADYRVFTLRTDFAVSPRTGQESEFIVLESPDWVNVIALTPDRRLVMVEQYRHGTDTIELEIPGGLIDPHDGSPIEAAVRELREETGYAGQNPRVLGVIFPNPAIMTNRCHTILVEHCERRHPTAFDHGEDLNTRLVRIEELPGLVASGRIMHSLVAVALYHFDLWQRGLKPNGGLPREASGV